jgi:16S rRNA (guanine527-N7)-methyltransferase
MTEDDAKKWLREQLSVSRETEEKLTIFVDFLKRETKSQNLVSATTVSTIWDRHVVDSAQLLHFSPNKPQSWLDLGSGAGFPGVVIALLTDFRVTLVESRARRIDYLQRAIALLDLESRVTVEGKMLEHIESAPYSVISARAFAPLPRLLDLAARFSTQKTVWLLPKGRNAAREWSAVQSDWNGDFRIEPSITDANAGILVGHLAGKRSHSADPLVARHTER